MASPAPGWVWLLPVAVPAWWAFVTTLISRLGGWARLAERYPDPGASAGAGTPLRFRSLQLGRWSSYNGCVHFEATPQGLRLSVFLPFRPGHPPILIPWGELSYLGSSTLLWFRSERVAVGSPAIVELGLQAREWEALRPYFR